MFTTEFLRVRTHKNRAQICYLSVSALDTPAPYRARDECPSHESHAAFASINLADRNSSPRNCDRVRSQSTFEVAAHPRGGLT
jgi:hypothetical protein